MWNFNLKTHNCPPQFSPLPHLSLTIPLSPSLSIMDQQELIPSGPATYSQWPGRRKISLRRRKLPSSRLGGKKPARGFFLVRLFRRARLRLAKLRRANMLMKLKLYYRSLVKDIMEGTATLEAVQQRMLMETSFAIPVMGVSFNSSFPNHVYGTY